MNYVILSDEQRKAIAAQVATTLRLYHATKSTENSHDPFSQMLLNMGWGMVIAVATLCGKDESDGVKVLVERSGVPIPTELSIALHDVVQGRTDAAVVLGVEGNAKPRGRLTYRASDGREEALIGTLAKTTYEGRLHFVIITDAEETVLIPIDRFVNFVPEGPPETS